MKLFALLVVAAVLAPTAWAGNSSGSLALHQGVSSPKVATLQMFLHANQRGDFYTCSCGFDQAFGPLTNAGLRSWQKVAGYPVTGWLSVGSRQWNQLRREATVSRLPAGIDRRSVTGAKRDGWSIDASKTTNMLYLLHYNAAVGQVMVAVSSPTSFAGCNADGCFTTPEGACPITRKAGVGEISHVWGGAPMPYAMYIGCGNGGVAVHYDPLSPSHGCIHVPDMSLMAYMNRTVPLGALVVVHR